MNKEFLVLKIDIPSDVSPKTPWEITRLSPVRYYIPLPPKRTSWDIPGATDYTTPDDLEIFPHNSDVYTVMVKRKISLTPMTLDMTAGVDFGELEKDLRLPGSHDD